MHKKTNQTIKLCGANEYSQLLSISNNKDAVMNLPAISPPLDLDFDISSIASYSIYSDHSVIITKNGDAFGIGNNEEGKIIRSLPFQVFNKYTKFEIKD